MNRSSNINRRPLGRTGYSVSPLGFGAAPVGFLKTEQKQIATILNHLLDAGMNLIDTAAAYEGSEEAIGKAVSHRRDDFVLVSKCGQKFAGLPGEAWSAAMISATIDRSLQRLGTDHIDIMLLHSCDLGVLEKGEALGALVQARAAGKIRFAGYSGDNQVVAYAAALPEIAVIETSISLVDQANIEGVLPRARERELGVIAKRPIANGAWRPLEAQHSFYREYAAPYHQRFAEMGLRLEDFAADAVTDWAELALRFTLSIPGVHAAIVGTTRVENALRNVELAAKPPLSHASVQKLRDAFAAAEARTAHEWPGLV
jgi:aryl-alcohol dehydrogenase-like predicted oxidoreductase